MAGEIEITVPPDDFSVTVPEEKTENTAWFDLAYMTDNSANRLTDNSGNYLVFTKTSTENVYVLTVPPDDLSVTITEET
jgi:hypothetical protein